MAVVPATQPIRLRDLDFHDAALRLEAGKAPVRFAGGEAVWDGQPVRIAEVAFGDLDGDGRDEAVVHLRADITKRTMDPERGVWVLIYAGTAQDLRLRASREFGLVGRDPVSSVAVVRGKIVVRGAIRGPGDTCLAGHRRETTFALTRQGLMQRSRRVWAPEEEPARLGAPDVQRGMKAVKGRVRACGRRHGRPGVVQVRLTIDGGGRVTAAGATGRFVATPLGDCVAAAVRRARFGRTGSAPTTLTYPFMVP